MIKRNPSNPILIPQKYTEWEAFAAFNPSVVRKKDTIHLAYRAMSQAKVHHGVTLPLSTIGYAKSKDGIHFSNRRQLIKPDYAWEAFGCEDPRVTEFEGRYFIFYTALSSYPFSKDGIKIGVAITSDFETIQEKHPVTSFNSKAMVLFPEAINGKIAALLTVHTDMPPAKIALALFDEISEIWSKDYWQKWYTELDDHVIPLMRDDKDQVEVGAVPIKTKEGWLVVYCYIRNYQNLWGRIFGIEAVLLDLENPKKIVGRTIGPLLTPEEDYERVGNVPNIAFPSGALVFGGKLFIYYGAADTTSAVASVDLESVLQVLLPKKQIFITKSTTNKGMLARFSGNPIIAPIPEFDWERKATFNPAAIYEDGKIHIIYRAMSSDNTSVLGLATTLDGFRIEERLTKPIYKPTEDFEKKKKSGNSGCEDPRITRIGDRLYMCYTAFDGVNPPGVALTSIAVEDFFDRQWNWEKPKLISLPDVDDKDACILPKEINGGYMIFHRIESGIYVDFVSNLNFSNGKSLRGDMLFRPRKDKWDSRKIGICAAPLMTEKGWLLLYHGISNDFYYRAGVALLDLNNPLKVIARSDYPILEPQERYEKEGQVPNVVFPCGAVVVNDTLFVYYGGADKVVGVATANINDLVDRLLGAS